jgi:glycosyltransferase involved in cell wall biosynthesis
MRIVVINDFLAAGSGGAGVAVLRTFRHVARRAGVDGVTVIGFRSDLLNYTDEADSPRFRVELWPGMRVSWWANKDGMVLLPSHTIQGRLAELRPDVLVAASPTLVCLQALHFARRSGVPSVYISQTQAEALQPYLPRWLGPKIAPVIVKSVTRVLYPPFAKADAVVFPTETARDLMEKAAPSFSRGARAVVISNSVDTSRYCPSPDGAEGPGTTAPRFVYVGRLMRDKLPDMPIRGLAIARSRGVSATLTVVGRGPLQGSLKRLADNLGVASHVHFTGLVREGAVIRHLRGATATIVPSFAETQSLVALESIACGTPVVSADAPANAASHIVRRHGCGDLYAYDDPASLADALARAATRDERYRQWRANCIEARRLFSLEAVTARWLDLCHVLLTEKARVETETGALAVG